MTPAEFDTRRRALGLSVDEVAALCHVQDRTARRWAAPLGIVPYDVPDKLDDLEAAMRHRVDAVLATARAPDAVWPVILHRYRSAEDLAAQEGPDALPPGAHAMMIAWAAEALAVDGIASDIQWWQPADAPRHELQYPTPAVPPGWARARNTHELVGMAIHAISDRTRSPEAIWEAPTPAEWDHVAMAVENYLLNDIAKPAPDGRYGWGEETVIIPATEE